jgi:polysaccharide export outer membrane protein
MSRSSVLIGRMGAACLTLCILLGMASIRTAAAQAPPVDAEVGRAPIMQLGAGDSITISVYGQPDMGATLYVGDDGVISVPLAGNVQVAGLSPAQASARIESALKNGKILVDPHVSITVATSRSQRVSVLGQVNNPGRIPIDSTTTIFDLLAQAGGVNATGSDLVYVIRHDKDGREIRLPVDLRTLANGGSMPDIVLKGGDSVFVPKAEQFSIAGEVTTPGRYRIDGNMTVVEAIARAGGITQRGSARRVEIKRKGPNGAYTTFKAKSGEPIQPDDIIQVKESIF